MPNKLLNAPTLVGAGLGGATGLAINRLALGNKSLLSNLLATAAGGALGGIAGHYINKNITDTVAQNEAQAEKEKAEKEKRLAEHKAATNAQGVLGDTYARLGVLGKRVLGDDASNKTVDKLAKVIVKADEAAKQAEKIEEAVKEAVSTGATALNQTVAKASEMPPAVKEVIAPENIAAGVAAVGGGVASSKAKDWIRKKTETQKGAAKETPKGLTKETPLSTDVKIGEYRLAPHAQPVTMTMDQFGKVKLQVDGHNVTRQDILGMSPNRDAAKTALREIGSQVEKIKQANKIIKTQKVEVVHKLNKPIITLDGLRIEPSQLTPEEQVKAETVVNEMNEAVKAAQGKKRGKKRGNVNLGNEHIANRETPTGAYKPVKEPQGVDVSVILPGLEEKKVSYSLTENGVPEVKIDGKPVNVTALDSKTRKVLLKEMIRDPRVKTNLFKLFLFGNSGENQFMNRLKGSIPLRTRFGMGLKNSIKGLAKGTVKAGGSSLVHAGLTGWLAREATKALKDPFNNFVGNYFENYAREANAKKAPEIERRMRLEELLRRSRQNSK